MLLSVPLRFRLVNGAVAIFALAGCLANDVAAQLPPQAAQQPGPRPPSSVFQRLIHGPNPTDDGVVIDATTVLRELSHGTATQIPENLLASAEGVAIVPRYIRGAFVIGVAGGRGVLMVRDANRNWQAPEFMTIGGGSVGWQAGVQSTDLVLVFRSPRSLANIRNGTLTLGANVSAAAGPIGRFASAATDTSAQAEIFTYSRTRGLFAGIALDGASLQIDVPATQAFYRTNQGGAGVIPASAIALVEALTQLSRTVVPASGLGEEPPLTGVPGVAQANSVPPSTVMPSTVMPSAVMPDTATVMIPPGGLNQLESEVVSLLTHVDDQWKLFLALPADWQGATQLPVGEINSTLARYESVASNPKFAALSSMPAFQQAIASLRTLAAQPARPGTLVLPPPPSNQVR